MFHAFNIRESSKRMTREIALWGVGRFFAYFEGCTMPRCPSTILRVNVGVQKRKTIQSTRPSRLRLSGFLLYHLNPPRLHLSSRSEAYRWAGFQFFDGTIDEDECLRCTAKSPLKNRFARNFIMNRDSLSPKVVLPILGLGCDFDIDVEITT